VDLAEERIVRYENAGRMNHGAHEAHKVEAWTDPLSDRLERAGGGGVTAA
jgi:hypothetical protein